jgi:antitoxin (DNA-binding transcriptional repressor) of toxin-antitoxin stability system
MNKINLQDIQRDPRAFLDRVEAGEFILLVKDDLPIAEITPVSYASSHPRPYGLCEGEFEVPTDFDHPLPEHVLREFEGP